MTRVPKRITVRMLEQMGACGQGIAEFRKEFGESADFVPGNIYQFYDRKGPHMTASLNTLLRYFDADEADAIESDCIETPVRCICDERAAAALCRLARQNLPKNRKARAA